MTKKEAIEKMVEREFHPISVEWVKIVAEHHGEYPVLPMWGTVWQVDGMLAETLMGNSRSMVGSLEDINYEDFVNEGEAEKIKKAVKEKDYSVLEEYIDEEMSGARCILDKDGNTTAVYIYELDGQYLVGINGAGWDFYDGVWDRLYDLLGLEWHEAEPTIKAD